MFKLWEKPRAEEITMIAGWRQWADAGSMSSGLPQYLIDEMGAEKIGEFVNDGFYMFQIPGTHDLVRPVVRMKDGYPEYIEERTNELFYVGDGQKGLLIFLGDEPHMDIDRYAKTFFSVAKEVGVKRIISLGGVYGELPYDKERTISCLYSHPSIKAELENYVVRFSGYQGGASVGSYLCKKAEQVHLEYIGFYAFVPTYDFSNATQQTQAQGIRIENDFVAWHGVMKRLNHMLNLEFDLTDLSLKAQKLIEVVDAKVEELEREMPDMDIQAYLERISAEFEEQTFMPLDDVWEEELRNLFDGLD
ncbi:MAG: PAC2 family protein [Candidatus Promineifilaceae bacterium]